MNIEGVTLMAKARSPTKSGTKASAPPDWKTHLPPSLSCKSHVGQSDLGLYVVQDDVELLGLLASVFLMLGSQVCTQVYTDKCVPPMLL